MAPKKTVKDAVTYCNVTPMLETMKLLEKRHLELLEKTPFWPLLEAFHNGNISAYDHDLNPILKLIKCFNHGTRSFHFGTRAVSITTEDISHILGLPQHGETVDIESRSKRSKLLWKRNSVFIERHFKGKEGITHSMIHSQLVTTLNGKDKRDIEDVVRLVLMYLFSTFLFAQARLALNLVRYCDEFDQISRYSWAEAVEKVLIRSLKTTKTEVGGCVLIIPFWFGEKTNIIQPILGRERHTAALVKWSLEALLVKMKQIPVCNIEPLFKEKNEENEVEVETDGEKQKHQREKELKKENKREVRKLIEEDKSLLEFVKNLEDKLKVTTQENGELIKENKKLKDQLNLQSSTKANQLSSVNEHEVPQTRHQMKSPVKGVNKRIGKQQLDPDLECNAVPKTKKARKEHATSDNIAGPSRALQGLTCKGDLIMIDEDPLSDEEISSRKQFFGLEKCDVFKLMDEEYKKRVKAFWNMADSKELFWSGKIGLVTREDVKRLIKDGAVATNVIDAFMELLELEQRSNEKRSTYISTLSSTYLQTENTGRRGVVRDEVGNEVGLTQFVYDPLLRNIANSNYVFVPVISKFHYTLLVLNTNERKWTHYNPFRRRSEKHIDPCYETAKEMHRLIQKWLHKTQMEAPESLGKGTKRKMVRREEKWGDVPLKEEETRTLTWMINNDIDFKIENDLNCPQQDCESLDCGLFVMYYMNQISKGLQLEEEISECRMWEFRKDLIKVFMDHKDSWSSNSTRIGNV